MNLATLLLYGLLISNVLLRAFTNKLGIIPRAFNTIDVPLAVALYLVSLRFPAPTDTGYGIMRFGGRLLLFNLIIVVGALLNTDFLHLPAALSQFIMWNEPLLVGLAIQRIPFTTQEIEGFRKLLVRLLVLQVVLGFLQFPIYLKTGETESMVGTFYGNAEQYQAFVMMALYYLFGRRLIEPDRSKSIWFSILAILGLIVLIDNKASWLGLLASIAVVFHYQGLSGNRSPINLRTLIPLGALGAIGAALVVAFSPSVGKLTSTLERFTTGEFLKFGKMRAYLDILQAFVDHPHMAVVGSGPGNFYSRAGRQFYFTADRLFGEGYASGAALTDRQSNALGGLANEMMGTNPFYWQFYENREIARVGSAKLDEPFSSFTGLLGETGVLGSLLYLSIYLTAFRCLAQSVYYHGDSATKYLLALSGLGLLVAMVTNSVYWNWLETGRIATILWSVIALGCKAPPEPTEEWLTGETGQPDETNAPRPQEAPVAS